FDISTVFSKQPIRPTTIKGKNTGVVIVSNAGGPAIISTDVCSKYDLEMADISTSREAIAKVIPQYGSANNPIDIVGYADATRFEKVLTFLRSTSNLSG
ncbi:MAG TPA: CoA-binding protein, partial [Candidatus Bathyarchaeia archaeon]|nr:CoA-binding protein [Candidatus Bathyarchaeia archaeon]